MTRYDSKDSLSSDHSSREDQLDEQWLSQVGCLVICIAHTLHIVVYVRVCVCVHVSVCVCVCVCVCL